MRWRAQTHRAENDSVVAKWKKIIIKCKPSGCPGGLTFILRVWFNKQLFIVIGCILLIVMESDIVF